MGEKTETIGIDRWDLMRQTGETTEVSDWVIDRDLSLNALALFVRMCRNARDEDAAKGVRLTLSKQQIDEFARGDGDAALNELMEAGAVTLVASYVKRGKARFEIEEYPPEVREQIGKAVHVEDLPVVTYG